MYLRQTGFCAALLCLLAAFAGCGVPRETLPARSAIEQLLISTAADRAIARLPGEPLAGKTVFVDGSNLECLDKPYVTQRIRQAVLESGASLAASREDAEVVLEAASGMLSVNKRDYLFGLPSLSVPVPFAGGAFTLPEVALFKVVSYRGRAKLTFNAVDTATNTLHHTMPVCYGKSLTAYWKLLVLFGPYEWTDLPEDGE